MITKDYSQFNKLMENIGKPVLFEVVTSGKSRCYFGNLSDVKPFEHILYSGHMVNFVGLEHAISTVLDENGELLFHNPNISQSYFPHDTDEIRWTRYFSRFYDSDCPEGKIMDDHESIIASDKNIKTQRTVLAVEGGKVTRKDARPYWNEVCKQMSSYSSWIITSSLEVMTELAKGYHPELDKVSRKYGLSGWQYTGMKHLVHRCAINPHPVIEHDFSEEKLPDKLKRPIY